MADEPRSLAVLLRCLQWELDEAAFEISAGRYSSQQRKDLAYRMTQLAHVLGDEAKAVVITESGH